MSSFRTSLGGIAAAVVAVLSALPTASAQPDTYVRASVAWPVGHMHTEVMFAPSLGGDVETKPVSIVQRLDVY